MTEAADGKDVQVSVTLSPLVVPMKRVAVTGSTGYLGSCLIAHLRRCDPEIQVLGLDVVPPADGAGYEFLPLDMQSQRLESVLRRFEPDTVVHMGFIVPPEHNERHMHQVNVGGTENVLHAVAAVRPSRCLITSSGTALGAWSDNPVPMDDWHVAPARPAFSYAAHKHELEQKLIVFAEQNPDIAVSWVRPCIVGGPNMENYLRRVLIGTPLTALLDGVDTPLQLVHEDDVSAALERILLADGRGPYNIAPPDWMTLSAIAARIQRRTIRLPFRIARWLAGLAWLVRFPPHEYPPAFLHFVRYPWVIAPARLEQELGFHFRYTTEATLTSIVEQTPQS